MIGGLDDVYDLVNGLKPIKGILVSESVFDNVRECDA